MEFLEIPGEIDVHDLTTAYQARVVKVETPLQQYRLNLGDVASKQTLYTHAGIYGNGGHIPIAGLSHYSLTNSGNNSHAAIDEHISDATIHFSELYQVLTLSNDWIDLDDSVWGTAMAYKLRNYVRLSGLIKDGTSTTLCTLPSAYRPSRARMQLVITQGSNIVRCDIGASGVVTITGTVPAWVNLSTIGYRL